MPPTVKTPFTVLIVGALLAVGCGSSSADDSGRFGGRVFRRVPTAAVDTTLPGQVAAGGPTTTAKPTYEVSVKPYTCPFDRDSANRLKVDCMQLIVPERREDPNSPKIFLSVAKINSTSAKPQPDPVIYLEGGPGGSAVTGIDRWTKPVSPLLAERDVFLIDQRGTGYSAPRLNCDRAFLGSPRGSLDDQRPAMEKCLKDLTAEKIDPQYYNTTTSAADLDDLRRTLKIDKWNLFGISYGTRLALRTMQLYPHGIRSAVIDSVYPPAFAKGFEDTAPNFNRALEELFAGCAASPQCGPLYPNLRGAFYSTVDRLNANPIQYETFDPASRKYIELEFTGSEYLLYLFQALYSTEVIRDVPRAINAASLGELEYALDLLSGLGVYEREQEGKDDDHYRPESSARRPRITDGLNSAVECAETAPGSSAESINAAAEGLPPQIATAVAGLRIREWEVCQVWNVPAKPLDEVTSDIPTLVLAGTYDPITPPSWAARAAELLPNSRFMTMGGAGHAVYYAGDCPKQLVTEFINDPVGKAGPECPGGVPEFANE